MTDVVGGIILEKRIPETLSEVSVSWSWHDVRNGTVEWTFKNNTSSVQSFLLLRNSYYFGNAFWPVYINNSGFNEKFAISVLPLQDQAVGSNSAPLCVAEFPDKKRIGMRNKGKKQMQRNATNQCRKRGERGILRMNA